MYTDRICDVHVFKRNIRHTKHQNGEQYRDNCATTELTIDTIYSQWFWYKTPTHHFFPNFSENMYVTSRMYVTKSPIFFFPLPISFFYSILAFLDFQKCCLALRHMRSFVQSFASFPPPPSLTFRPCDLRNDVQTVCVCKIRKSKRFHFMFVGKVLKIALPEHRLSLYFIRTGSFREHVQLECNLLPHIFLTERFLNRFCLWINNIKRRIEPLQLHMLFGLQSCELLVFLCIASQQIFNE